MTRRYEKYKTFAFFLKVMSDETEYAGPRIAAVHAIEFWNEKSSRVPLMRELLHGRTKIDVRRSVAAAIHDITREKEPALIEVPIKPPGHHFYQMIDALHDMFSVNKPRREGAVGFFMGTQNPHRAYIKYAIPFLLAVTGEDPDIDIRMMASIVVEGLAVTFGVKLPNDPESHAYKKHPHVRPEPFAHNEGYSNVYLHHPIDIALFAKNPVYRFEGAKLLMEFADQTDIAKSFLARVALKDPDPRVRKGALIMLGKVVKDIDSRVLEELDRMAEFYIPKGTFAPSRIAPIAADRLKEFNESQGQNDDRGR